MILDLRALMLSTELDLSAFGAKSNRVWPGHPGCQKNVKDQGLLFNQQHSDIVRASIDPDRPL